MHGMLLGDEHLDIWTNKFFITQNPKRELTMSSRNHENTVKALYRIDEVAEILSVSRRTVYRLLAEGKLVAHSRKPGKSGMRITAWSIREFISKYELPSGYFLDNMLLIEQSENKT